MSANSVQHVPQPIFFLETSACIDYALRANSEIYAPYNEMVTHFLGLLRSQNITIVTSETVRKETQGQLPLAITQMLEKTNIRRKGQTKKLISAKCGIRCKKLWTRIKPLSLNGNVTDVRIFYTHLSQTSEVRSKLQKISRFKHRKRLLPEDSDMKILSDAISLKNGENTVFFISKDEDYCSFSEEIRKKFGIAVIRLQDLFKFSPTIPSLKGLVNWKIP